MSVFRRDRSVCQRVYLVGGPGESSGDDCMVYLVDAGHELVLIDAGCGPSLDRILQNVEDAGFKPHRVGHVVATHCHIDHIGGLRALVDLYGPKVIAHQGDREGIEEGRGDLTAAALYGLRAEPVRIDLMLQGEEEVHTLGDLEFHFLHTPGHTPGSISVYLDISGTRVLFGQDIHGPFSPSWGSDLASWRESMQKLMDLDADILCEGHTGVFKGKEKVKGYIQGYLNRYS